MVKVKAVYHDMQQAISELLKRLIDCGAICCEK